ncbi:MAG: hypothetical protein CSA62_00615 [Planctomycetota bacterium]|nr:MAG: hypothetical protein CSA62_00615 [Planctomycetota bacterium]
MSRILSRSFLGRCVLSLLALAPLAFAQQIRLITDLRGPSSMLPGTASAQLSGFRKPGQYGVTGLSPFAGGLFGYAKLKGTAQLVRIDAKTGAYQTLGVHARDSLDSGTVVGSRLFFFADLLGLGKQLFVSDGTAAGTKRVGDFAAKLHYPRYRDPAAVGGKLLFVVSATGTGDEIYVSDGTLAGTKPLQSRPGQLFHNPRSLLSSADQRWVVFSATKSSYPYDPDLWITDGTLSGTRMLFDAKPGYGAVIPHCRLGKKIIFQARDSKAGALWSTDGTKAGTQRLSSSTGPVLSGASEFYVDESAGKAYFSGSTGTYGSEPWVTDGTLAGTRLFADVANGFRSSSPRHLLFAHGKLWFQGEVQAGAELYVSDGTAQGTKMLRDIAAGVSSSIPSELVPIDGGRILFRAQTRSSGSELYVSDGTTQGTKMVKELWPGRTNGCLGGLYSLGKQAVFIGNDQKDGQELWISDGSAAGTRLYANVNQVPRTRSLGSRPSNFARFGRYTVFNADDGVHGRWLWISDGTAQGTRLLGDPKKKKGPSDPADFCVLGDQLLFSARTNYRRQLWISDGTSRGTRPLRVSQHSYYGLDPKDLTRVGNRVYFSADDGVHGREIWVSDGTAKGTRLAIDLVKGAASSQPKHFFEFNGELGFVAESRGPRYPYGIEPMLSDGTLAGTRILCDIEPGGLSSRVQDVEVGGGRVWLLAHTLLQGLEIWVSDGTPAGTKCIDLDSGPSYRNKSQLRFLGGKLYFAQFVGSNTNDPEEIWVSDGTLAGTKKYADFPDTTRSYSPRNFTVLGSRHLLMTALDYEHGKEFWRLDGKRPQALFAETGPAGQSAWPSNGFQGLEPAKQPFCLSRDGLVFAGSWYDPQKTIGALGSEPWLLSYGAMSLAEGFGYAAPGQALPTLASTDPVLGQQVTLSGKHAPKTSPAAVLLLGVPHATQLRLAPEAFSLVDLKGFWWIESAFVPSATWQRKIALPNDRSLSGLSLALQCYFAGVATPLGIGMSNGVFWRLGL